MTRDAAVSRSVYYKNAKGDPSPFPLPPGSRHAANFLRQLCDSLRQGCVSSPHPLVYLVICSLFASVSQLQFCLLSGPPWLAKPCFYEGESFIFT